MTERAFGDPFGGFSCPKCGGLTVRPRLKWVHYPVGVDLVWVWCDDCGYSESRPTVDAAGEES